MCQWLAAAHLRLTMSAAAMLAAQAWSWQRAMRKGHPWAGVSMSWRRSAHLAELLVSQTQSGCLNDAPCSPCTRHGASIKQPFGAGQAGSMMSAGRRMPSHSHTVAHGRSDPVGDALERRLDCLEVRGLARASRGPNALF